MKTRYALTLIALSLPVAAYVDRDASAARSIYLNKQGGINPCSLARFASDKAYCDGADVPSHDPKAFDCRVAETPDEYRFCHIPFPR